MQEMGFRIARKHAAKLRRLVLLAGFGGPFILIALGQVASGIAGPLPSIASLPLLGFGLAAERWLFFAEARHVVTLYYGQSRA